MNDRYLIPSNSKKGNLILGMFLPIDLLIAAIGLVVTFLLLIIFGTRTLWLGVVSLLPLIVCAMLVFPIPNYHNVRTFISEMINFFMGLRKYIWKGWCYTSESEQNATRANTQYTTKK